MSVTDGLGGAWLIMWDLDCVWSSAWLVVSRRHVRAARSVGSMNKDSMDKDKDKWPLGHTCVYGIVCM